MNPGATSSSPATSSYRLRLNESWLLRLRWVAVVGQLLTVTSAAYLLQVDLPLMPLLTIVCATAVTNTAFALWLRPTPLEEGSGEERRNQRVLTLIMTMDLIALTALLYFTGGPMNPFVVFFFVNLGLAAVILPAAASWTLTLLAVVCLAGLYLWHIPLVDLTREVQLMERLPVVTLQQLGFVVAFASCAGVITYFVTRVTRELQLSERGLRIAEQQRARSERLEALATLAAGAGHELASPLSTIAVIANDLSRHLDGTDVPPSVLEDVQLIRSELDHCRTILNGLASSAGQASGEEMDQLPVTRLVDEVLGVIRRRDQVDVELADVATLTVTVPRMAVAQAIRGIVRNALDASPPQSPVQLTVQRNRGGCQFHVRDHGAGMTEETLHRAGEPFFTTKEPGKGMGLGIFLTRNVIERLGGSFQLVSQPQVGTTATIWLPCRPEASGAPAGDPTSGIEPTSDPSARQQS